MAPSARGLQPADIFTCDRDDANLRQLSLPGKALALPHRVQIQRLYNPAHALEVKAAAEAKS